MRSIRLLSLTAIILFTVTPALAQEFEVEHQRVKKYRRLYQQ